jgi:metalloproteinase inhibitor 3
MFCVCSFFSIEIGQLYAIAGITNRVSICQYVREYSSLSQIEKRGIAGAYKKGCSCDVS